MWLAFVTVLAFLASGVTVGTAANAVTDSVTVSGTVTDSQGSGIPEIDVEILDSNGAVVASASTDASGQYALTDIASDTGEQIFRSLDFSYLNQSTVIDYSQGDVESNAVLEVHPQNTLSGAVFDSATGLPLSGVSLTATNPNDDVVNPLNPISGVVSDGDGNFSITNIPSSTVDLVAVLEGYDTFASAGEAVDTDRSGVLEIYLGSSIPELAGVITGSVTDELGQPVAFAELCSKGVYGSGCSRFVTADEQGTYAFNNLPDDVYTVYAWSPIPGPAPLRKKQISVVEGGQTLVDFVFSKPNTVGLTGYVKDPDGNPVSGVLVDASSTFFSQISMPATQVTTDENGFFQITDLSGRADVQISVTDDPDIVRDSGLRYRSAFIWRTAIRADGATNISVTVRPHGSGTLMGTLVDALTDEPIVVAFDEEFARNQIWISERVPCPQGSGCISEEDISTFLTTDTEGQFIAPDLPRSRLQLHLQIPGYDDFTVDVDLRDTAALTRNYFLQPVSAVGLGEIRGTVTEKDASGNAIPVKEANFSLYRQASNEWRSAQTDSLGQYTLTDLRPGTYIISALNKRNDATGYELYKGPSDYSSRLIEVAPGQQVVRDVTLERIKTGIGVISGKVVDAATGNSPVAGAQVSLWSQDGGQVSRFGQTEEDGTFSWTDIPAGKYSVNTGTYGSPEFENSWQSISVDLTTAASRTGVTFSYSSVLPGSAVISGIARSTSGYAVVPFAELRLSRVKGGMEDVETTANVSGAFRFGSLPAGQYNLTIQASGFESSKVQVDLEPGEALRYRGVLRPLDEQTVSAAPGRVVVQLRDPNGNKLRPLKFGSLYLSGPSGNSFYDQFDSEGLAVIEDLAPGTYTATIRGVSEAFIAAPFTVTISAAQPTVTRDVMLLRAASVSGIIRLSSGAQWGLDQNNYADAIYVELLNSSGQSLYWTRADGSTGEFIIPGVAPGSYTLRAGQTFSCACRGDGGDATTALPSYSEVFGTSSVVVTEGSTITGKDLTVYPGGAIVGTVGVSAGTGITSLPSGRIVQINTYKLNGSTYSLVKTGIGMAGTWNAGVFALTGLTPGTYKLEYVDTWTGNRRFASSYSGGASSLATATPISVTANTVTNVATMGMSVTKPTSLDEFTTDNLDMSLENEVSAPDELVVGSDEPISVGEDMAGQWVTVWAAADSTSSNTTSSRNSQVKVSGPPSRLSSGWVLVDAKGQVTVRVPAAVAVGQKRIVVQDSDSQVVGWTSADIVGVPSQPTALAVVARTTKQVTLSWSRPTSGFASVTGYVLQRRTGSGWVSSGVTIGAAATSATVAGLVAGSTNDFRLRASTQLNDVVGDWSETFTVSTLSGVPVAPGSVSVAGTSTVGQATVSWVVPSGSGLNGATLSGFTVQHRLAVSAPDGSWSTFTPTTGLSGSSSSTTVTGLAAGTYQFRVQAKAASGAVQGLWSDPLTATIGRPNVPTSVKASAVAATSTARSATVQVSWVLPVAVTGVVVTGFDVYSRLAASAPGGSWTKFTPSTALSGTSTSTTVTGLALSSDYQFKVVAKSATQISADSVSALATTFSGVPVAPTSVTSVAASATSVKVSWVVPPAAGLNGTTLSGFTVQYRLVSSSPGGAWSTFTPTTALVATSTSATVTGLTTGQAYQFRVTAKVGSAATAYNGTPSTETVFTPGSPNLPGSVTAIPDSATSTQAAVNLSWSAPTAATGVTLTGYRVLYRPADSDVSWTSSDALATAGNLIVAGLTPNARYEFTVCAKTSIIVGPSSRIVYATTGSGFPGGLGNVSAKSAGASSITISWMIPSGSGWTNQATVSGYSIQYRQVTNPQTNEWLDFSPSLALTPTSTTATVTGLDTGSPYEFKVAAKVGSGEQAYVGRWSLSTEATPGLPQAPAIMSTSTTLNSASVTWGSLPSVTGMPLTGYIVDYRLEGDRTWTSQVVAGTAVTKTLTGLASSARYQIRVTAQTATGLGRTSPMLTVSTLSGVPVAPGSVSVAGTSTVGQATVSWVVPSGSGLNGATLSGFTVQHRLAVSAPDGSWSTFTPTTGLSGSSSSTTVTGLAAGTYQFRVQAKAASGAVQGLWSDPLTATIGRPNVPTSVKASAVAATSTARSATVQVSWVLPVAVTGVVVTGFDVYSRLAASAPGGSWTKFTPSTALSGTSTSTTVTGLALSSDYQFKVVAKSATQISADSVSALATTFSGVPVAPTSVTSVAASATSVKVSWVVPPAAGLNGTTLSGFTVQYRLVSSSPGGAWSTFTPTTALVATSTSATVTGLTTGQAYQFRVTAKVGSAATAYNGTPSTETVCAPGVATAMTALTSPAASPTTLTVKWIEAIDPLKGYGVLRNYLVEYRLASTGPTGAWTSVNVGATLTQSVLTGLTPNRVYEIRVRAVTSATATSGVLWKGPESPSLVVATGP